MFLQAEKEVYAPVASEPGSILETILASERTRLVRFCAHLTGNPDAAEDLAQETLLRRGEISINFTIKTRDNTQKTGSSGYEGSLAMSACAGHAVMAVTLPISPLSITRKTKQNQTSKTW